MGFALAERKRLRRHKEKQPRLVINAPFYIIAIHRFVLRRAG